MTRRLRIAIATAGRFHVLDLARELNALGYAVDFYSYVPNRVPYVSAFPPFAIDHWSRSRCRLWRWSDSLPQSHRRFVNGSSISL